MAVATPQVVNCKLLLLGDTSVGKSSLVLRFSDKEWLAEDEARTTVGVDFRAHYMRIRERKVKLSIWDTAGQEIFRSMILPYYRGAQGVILVYDVSRRESFNVLPKWYSELDKYVSSSVVKIVVGNKVDKESSRQVSTIEGQKFAKQMNSLFIETSAKTAIGVDDAFEKVVAQMFKTPALWAPASLNKKRRGTSGANVADGILGNLVSGNGSLDFGRRKGLRPILRCIC